MEEYENEAFAVKALDIASNALYIHLIDSKGKGRDIIDRNNFFLSKFIKYKNTPYWKEANNANNLAVSRNIEKLS